MTWITSATGKALLLVLFLYTGCEMQDDLFYYAFNEKIELIPVENKMVARYDSDRRRLFNDLNLPEYISGEQVMWIDDSTIVVTVKDLSEKIRLINNKAWQSELVSLQAVYMTVDGLEMYITDEILVRFHDEVSWDRIGRIHEKYNVRVVESRAKSQVLKVFRMADALKISRYYQESGLVLYSKPNFYSKIELLRVPDEV